MNVLLVNKAFLQIWQPRRKKIWNILLLMIVSIYSAKALNTIAHCFPSWQAACYFNFH